MLYLRGRVPRKSKSVVAVVLRMAGARRLLPLLAGLLVSTASPAQQAIPLTLAEAEDLALEHEPGQVALLAQAEALAASAIAAGQLPDPTLRLGIANFPLESGGFTTEAMTQAQVGIRQAFPPGQALAASTRRFESLSQEMADSAEGRRRDVLTAVRHAWLETYYWQRAHATLDEARPFFADLVAVTRSLYSLGRRDQQDLLRAELELSRVDDRIIEFNKQHMRAMAALSEWLPGDASRPISQNMPDWHDLPSLESMQSGLLQHPAVQAANARIDAQQASVEHAEESFKPGWALDLGYGHRDGFLPNGEPRSDFVSLSLTMDLPVFRKNRQNRRLSAALSERRAATESKAALLRQMKSRLDGEYARVHDLSRRIDLYDRQMLALSADHARASLQAYQSDAADFADVMRGYIDDINIRIEHVRLRVERAQSYAVLANLGGFRQ